MNGFTLTVPGDPQSKGRPRVFQGHGVTDPNTRHAEQKVRAAFQSAYPDWTPIAGPVRVSLEFWMKSRRNRDWDNLAKLATDALNGIAYKDDAQILEAHVVKRLPDERVPGKREGSMRNRRKGDQLTYRGGVYEPHTRIDAEEIEDQ